MPLPDFARFVRRYANVLFFIGGFIFDVFTLVRIDNWLDLLWQSGYLSLITGILLADVRQERGLWTPGPRLARGWHHSTEALHFCYGGLLSGYVIFYFKSTSASRSLVFLALVALLMLANEMPQVKAAGHKMRMGLYAFCLVSYFNYLIPVLVGRMGTWTFLLAVTATLGLCTAVVRLLSRWQPDPARARWSLGWPPAAVLGLIGVLYTLQWIPPVPLSVQFIGVFHRVERVDDGYRLLYPKPPWFQFWRKESRPFRYRPDDVIYCFARVFGPRRFKHRIAMAWSRQDPATGTWQGTDRIPMPIAGGREEGFRGFTAKSRFEPGCWRVEVQSEDGRVIGGTTFRVIPDPSHDERVWRQRPM